MPNHKIHWVNDTLKSVTALTRASVSWKNTSTVSPTTSTASQPNGSSKDKLASKYLGIDKQ